MNAGIPNIRHLRVFREVAHRHSISLAAEASHLSQPAVTQAIAKLESQLGTELFHRRRTGFVTTEIGTTFLMRIERALALLNTGARNAVRIGDRSARSGFKGFDRLVTSAQLRALVAVSDTQSFSLAARHIGISQPSLHRSARTLESLSGVALFSRTSTRVELTPAAEALVMNVKLAFSEIRQALDEVKEFQGHDDSRVVIGSLPLARTFILPRAVHDMIQTTKAVQIRVVDGPYEELSKGLKHGEIDMIIGALRSIEQSENIVQETLLHDPLAIVAGTGHPLAGRDHVTLAETLRYPWIAPPLSTPAGQYLYDTLRIQDLPQTPVRTVSSSLIFLRGMLAQGNYLTIISRHQIREEERQGLLVPLAVDLPNSERAIGLTFRRGWRPTSIQSRFIELLRESSRNVECDSAAL